MEPRAPPSAWGWVLYLATIHAPEAPLEPDSLGLDSSSVTHQLNDTGQVTEFLCGSVFHSVKWEK
jgi:hypothetical protein